MSRYLPTKEPRRIHGRVAIPKPMDTTQKNQQARSVGWAEEEGTKDHTQQLQISTNP